MIATGSWTVDAEDGVIYSRKTGSPMGSVKTSGYVELHCFDTPKTHKLLAHRVIWEAANGPILDPLLEINHINGVKADNRIANLELVTARENMLHRGTLQLAQA
jgi:hypothetical protein